MLFALEPERARRPMTSRSLMEGENVGGLAEQRFAAAGLYGGWEVGKEIGVYDHQRLSASMSLPSAGSRKMHTLGLT